MSFGIINFFTLLFWLGSVLFFFKNNNLLAIILYSEFIWVLLYAFTILSSTIVDDSMLMSTSFFLLALAGLEFCIGFIIVIFFRNLKKSLDLESFFSDVNSLAKNKENFASLNRYFWDFVK